MSIRSWYCWGTTPLLPTDIPGCYCHAKIRPWWYWTFRRVRLFLLIVWRRWDEQCGRLSIKTAWSVSSVAKGFTCDDAKGKS